MNLTIVMIGRNDIAHLKRSISIVQEQIKTGEHSLLYVDDCSEDGSFEFANMLKNESTEVIKTDHRSNIGGARNAGIKYLLSKPEDQIPEYVWFHDSDDYITPNAINRVMKVIKSNNHPDCVSVPIATLFKGMKELPKNAVIAKNIEESAFGPVGEWAQVFKTRLYVQNPENQACEDAPWHYLQFDKFETWAKVEGNEACYVWDNTNMNAISRTVDWCANNSVTLLAAGLANTVVNAGFNDKWISDNLRNIANMYDVRHQLTKPWVINAWRERYSTEVKNMMSGIHIH